MSRSERVQAAFTVFFEDPFWIGVYERREGGSLRAARIVFGPEPTDAQLYAWLARGWGELRFGPAVDGGKAAYKPSSPKRAQRQAAKQLEARGVGTKAQQALKAAHEEAAGKRKQINREKRREEIALCFARRQAKKKAKHKGR